MLHRVPHHILTTLTVIFALMLMASALTAYISPTHLHVLAFAGFGLPMLWIANVLLFVVNLIRHNWRRLLVGLIVIVGTWGHLSNCYQMNNLFTDPVSPKGSVKIMSFNTRIFDYYSWTGRKQVVDEMLTFVRTKNPDVVCFQEFFTCDNDENYAEHRIVSRLNGYKYRHIEYNVVGKNGKRFGQATFSKYPITGQKQIDFAHTSNFSIQTDIAIGNKTVRFFNNHLESIRLSNKHYNLLDNINNRSDAERKAGIIEIATKVNVALAQRAEQAEIIARHIANSPYPVVVCGDFNDTPVSYVYHTMRGELKDAFQEAGKGASGTYNGKLPSFRIDFIFFDPSFSASRFERFKVNYSDHFPIMAEISLGK